MSKPVSVSFPGYTHIVTRYRAKSCLHFTMNLMQNMLGDFSKAMDLGQVYIPYITIMVYPDSILHNISKCSTFLLRNFVPA